MSSGLLPSFNLKGVNSRKNDLALCGFNKHSIRPISILKVNQMSTETESVFLICFVLVNFADCLTSREMGMSRLGGGKFFTSRLNSEYGTRHMLSNSLLKETPVTVPNMNKVFCSQWLSDRQVVFGTKCNKVTYTLDH